jgi:hypothetical protein
MLIHSQRRGSRASDYVPLVPLTVPWDKMGPEVGQHAHQLGPNDGHVEGLGGVQIPLVRFVLIRQESEPTTPKPMVGALV